MHAGDALWRLYGCIALLERLHPADMQVSALVADMRNSAGVVGAHITVPEPSATDLGSILARLRGELPVSDAATKPPSQQKSDRNNFSDPEIVEAAKTFLGEMSASDLFSWAEMVGDISAKLDAGAAFFTFRQARAIINIARRGEFDDGRDFMDYMEAEYATATAAVKAWAEQA